MNRIFKYIVTTNLRTVVVSGMNKFRAAARVELAEGEVVTNIAKVA